MTNTQAARFTDRDLIENIIESYFIVDYGFIDQVNADGTIDVVHAKKGQTIDGKPLPEYATKRIELLTLSCAEFSIQLKPTKGDNVLLLGLKDYVQNAAGINTATQNDVFIHYQQNTMKAVPLSLFNNDAKLKIEIDGGDLSFVTDGKVKIKANQAEINCSSFKVTNENGSTTALEVTP